MRRPISTGALAVHLLSLYAPVVLTAVLPASAVSPWWWPYVLFLLPVAASGFAIALLAHRRTVPGRIVVAMMFQASSIILGAAAIFHAVGISDGRTVVRPTFADAVYFSIVTWTTLGYGDMQPPADYRLLAAAEALVGYVYLGLIVGLTTNLFRSEV